MRAGSRSDHTCSLRFLTNMIAGRGVPKGSVPVWITNWPGGPTGTVFQMFSSIKELASSTHLFGCVETLRRAKEGDTAITFPWCKVHGSAQNSIDGLSEIRIFAGHHEASWYSELIREEEMRCLWADRVSTYVQTKS